MVKKEFEEAWLCYERALSYKPLESIPKAKITEIKNNLFKLTTKDAAFKLAVENGDKFFNKNNQEARLFYEKSLLYMPGAKHPSDRIKEIDEALNQFGYMKQQSFANKVSLAENYFKSKNYEEALNNYQEAARLYPSNQVVLKKIEELKKLTGKGNEGNVPDDQNSRLEDINSKVRINNIQKEIDASIKKGDKKTTADLLVSLGQIYYETGNYGNTIENYAQSLRLKEETGDKKGVANLLNNIGDVYALSYNYDKAIENYEKALKTKDARGIKDEKEKILNKIGTMFYQQKNFKRAIDFFNKSLEIDEKTGDKKSIGSSLNNIGVAYYETGNYEKAVEYYEKALHMMEEIGSKKEISMSLNNLGNVNFDWKKFSKALEYYQRSLKYKEEVHYERGIVISLYNIANVYFETSVNDKAIEFYLKSREIAEKINLSPYVYMNNKSLAKVYSKLNNYKKAYDFLSLAKSSGEMAFESNGEKQLSEIHFKYNEEKLNKERKIESLEKQVMEQNLWVQYLNEKKIRDEDVHKKQKQIQYLKLKTEKIISFSLLAGFILLGILALVFFNRYRMKKRANNNLEKANNEILKEKLKSDKLLLNVLPLKVANDLKEYGKSEPELYPDVSVLFLDIIDFTSKAAVNEPQLVIAELNNFFSGIDEIMDLYHCERIKTMGDAYLAVCGLPIEDPNHSENIAKAALAILKFTKCRNETASIPWLIRMGLHTGEVVGGVVGIKKYIFDVFGDTINTAARMESNCEPMRINVSEAIYKMLKQKFEFTDRGLIQAKGKGELKMYFLENEIANNII